MASITLTGWTQGATVSAYLASSRVPLTALNPPLPSGTPVATATAAADGSVTLSGLSSGVPYIASDGSRTSQFLVPGASGAAGATGATFLPFSRPGVLTVASGTAKLRIPVDATIAGVSATVGAAAVGAAVVIDVNRNGTTIFTTQANRPQIAAGATAVGESVPNVAALSAGDVLTVDVDQVGSSAAGSDLTVVVRLA